MKAKYIIFALLALAVTSCDSVTDFEEDYVPQHAQPNSGAPVITGVYAVADADQLTPLTEAEPGQRLCIVGQNLNNLRSLRFNTVEADLADTYTQLTKAVVKIPAGFSKAHENVIEYTTDQGTARYAFVVTLPAAEVGGLLNEFAAAGSEVVVAGKNLQYYDFVLTLGGQTLPLTVGDNSLSFRIPEGTPDNSVFVISWLDAKGVTQQVEMPFRPTNDLLFSDLSQTTQQQTDKNVSIETSDQRTACLHFFGTIAEYAWVELSFEQPSIQAVANSQDYYFVFEVQNAAGKPLLGSGYEFAFNWDWNNSYRWNPGEGAGLNTNGDWQTVRYSLDEMAPNGLNAVGGSLTLNVGFQPDRDYEADFRLANFRIVKK